MLLRLTADELATVVDYWLAHVDHDLPEPGHDADRNQAHLSRTLGGRWRFDAPTGPEINTALQTST